MGHRRCIWSWRKVPMATAMILLVTMAMACIVIMMPKVVMLNITICTMSTIHRHYLRRMIMAGSPSNQRHQHHHRHHHGSSHRHTSRPQRRRHQTQSHSGSGTPPICPIYLPTHNSHKDHDLHDRCSHPLPASSAGCSWDSPFIMIMMFVCPLER